MNNRNESTNKLSSVDSQTDEMLDSYDFPMNKSRKIFSDEVVESSDSTLSGMPNTTVIGGIVSKEFADNLVDFDMQPILAASLFQQFLRSDEGKAVLQQLLREKLEQKLQLTATDSRKVEMSSVILPAVEDPMATLANATER